MKRPISFLILTVWSLCFFGAVSFEPPHAEEAARVAILPFTMNAERDLSFLKEGILDMLHSRISWKEKVRVIEKARIKDALAGDEGPMTPEKAREVAARVGADYALYGSLTVFGESVSLDATMQSLAKDEEPVTVFVESKGMETVIPEINKFAHKVNAKIFGRPYADEEFAYIPRGSGTDAPGDSGVSPLNPQFRRYHDVGVEGMSFWKSKTFHAEIRGMDIGDVNGDGQNELVLLEGVDVGVYRYVDGALRRLASHPSSTRDRFLTVDVADINGNGRAEIFASRVSGTTVTSVVLEWGKGGLVTIVKQSPWFFRVMDWPKKGRILVGQQKMPGSAGGYANLIRDYFESGIFELKWSGADYVKSGEEPLLDLVSDADLM